LLRELTKTNSTEAGSEEEDIKGEAS